MFERETRREKILEARNKEIRLKEKTKGILGLTGAAVSGAGGKAANAAKGGSGPDKGPFTLASLVSFLGAASMEIFFVLDCRN
jgi:hypothetical protein